MTTTIANALKVLAASAVLATALASPSLAQSSKYGGYGYRDAPPTSQGYWEHRQDWDR
jgi:hypothetical protein